MGLNVAEQLGTVYGFKVPESFRIMVESGSLGKKSGKGFYSWKNGKKVTPKSKASSSNDEVIQNRLILRFVNEAVACNREKVVESKGKNLSVTCFWRWKIGESI